MKISIPDKFKNYFWDYDIQNINIWAYIEFVSERLMEKGNWESAKWLLDNVPSDILLKISKQSPNLSKPIANFWLSVLA